jgi:hypothetical protein
VRLSLFRREVVHGLNLVGEDSLKLIPQAYKLLQPIHPSCGVTPIQPLESDQSPLLTNRVTSLGDHQLEGCPKGRIVELVDDPFEINT